MKSIRIGNIEVGGKAPIRINCNIGCNDLLGYAEEIEKINTIKLSGCVPDMMMDLSLIKVERPLYKVIIDELGIPVGTVLSYIPFSKERGLDWEECKTYLLDLCKSGISFVTIHFTANDRLLKLAKRDRLMVCTSRGGGLCLYDIHKNQRSQNLFYEHIDDVIEIVKTYDVAVSLGVTFRPATIFDACDEAHVEETKEQLKVCQYLQSRGVKVLVENVGHISIKSMETHAHLLQQFDAPLMPLGPIPTDGAINEDTDLSWMEWEGNEVFLSDEDSQVLFERAVGIIKGWRDQLVKGFPEERFVVFASFDDGSDMAEECEKTPSFTLRFWKKRDGQGPDENTDYDQPVIKWNN